MGFWSSLAKVGEVAASLIPGIGPIIGLGAGLAASSGSLASKLPGQPGGPAVGGVGGTGTDSTLQRLLAGAGTPNDNQVAAGNYDRTILNGSQDQIQGLLGPNIATVLSQYDNAEKSVQELGPRGGGRTEQLAELPFKKATAYGSQLAGARTGAAKDLGTLGSSEASEQGSALSSLLNNKNQEASLAYQKSSDTNKALSGLGSSFGGFLVDYLKNKGKSSGSGSTGIGAPGIDGAAGIDLGDI